MNKNERIYMLLKNMQECIERFGRTIKQVDFDLTPPSQDTDKSKFAGGEDFIDFQRVSGWANNEITDIVKACIARGYIKRGSISSEFGFLQITDTGICFVDNYEDELQSNKTPPISIGAINGPAQIGNHNTQNITIEVAIQKMLDSIESSDAPISEKIEAKSRLSKFLEHPIVAPLISDSIKATVLTGLAYIKGAI